MTHATHATSATSAYSRERSTGSATRLDPIAIGQDPGSDTLLTYAVLAKPDPLQVSGPGTLTLMLSNSRRETVTCTRIDVQLPVGVNAKDLTPSAAGINVVVPSNWQSSIDGGIVTLIPMTPEAGTIGGGGLTFIISAFVVNAQPGTCVLAITETASSPSQPKQARNATISLPKFPTEFQVSDLQAYPVEVATGGSTAINWAGSPNATYTLEYEPTNQGSPVTESVSNVGPYPTKPLTRTGSVIFTLTVKVAVAGQDQPLVVQRQVSVSVDTLSVSLTAAPLTVGANGLTRLKWTTANATKITLDPLGLTFGPNGDWHVTVPMTRVFTVTAYGFGGAIAQQQVTITVDPAIQPKNIQGYSIIGSDGGPGPDWQPGWPSYTGGTGGAGGDAILTATIPPLDVRSNPDRVMSITLKGGNGGKGGAGGNYGLSSDGNDNEPIGVGEHPRAGSGGYGGDGGQAKLTATFDPSLPPAQYIIVITAGTGGPHGQPGDRPAPGFPGYSGNDGQASMTFYGAPP